jgi:CHAT domain-containing protein
MFLKPNDIQSQKLTADLVFLSATRVVNQPASGFSSQPGLVSDFIDSGAGSVIARLWINGGGISEMFIGDFYRQLEASGDIADALRAARLNDLTRHRNDGLFDWAGYQLFIN